MADRWEQFFRNAGKRARSASTEQVVKDIPLAKGAGVLRRTRTRPTKDAMAVAKIVRGLRRSKGLGLGLAAGAVPILAPMLAKGAIDYGKSIADPIKRAVTGTGLGEMGLDDMIGMQREAENAGMQQQIRQRELEKLAAVNEQRLMQMAPGVASQLLAGRLLPRNAVVIGGNKRQDLLREFASQMATSPQFQGPPQGAEEFLQ